MNMRSFVFLFLLLPFIFTSAQDARYTYSGSISPDSIKKSVYTLASDSMEGRATGTSGQKMAARFLASKYQSLGLLPGGFLHDSVSETPNEERFRKNPFLQNHPLSLKYNKEKNLKVNGDEFLFGRDFIYPDIFKDTLIRITSYVFIAIGKKVKFNDVLFSEKYNNRVVVLFDAKESATSSFSGGSPATHSFSPSLVFIITSPEKIAYHLSNGFDIPADSKLRLIYITPEVAERMLDRETYLKLTKKAGRKGKMKELDESGTITVDLVSNTDALRGQNVVAILPGTDLSNEVIVISSHYDHLGIRDSAVYYGADDNASGTSAILEIARNFVAAKREGHSPRRSILFLNVSGEEIRLLGSAWYVNHPALSLKNTVADLNIDMVGRVDLRYDSIGDKNYMYIIGSDKMSTELHEINEQQNKSGPALKLDYIYNSEDDPNKYYRRSDHYNFVKNGVPVIFYFDGNHMDYHKPTDTAEKIDYSLLAQRARLIFLTAWELANRDKRITIDKKEETEK